jgi:hypothetical protein
MIAPHISEMELESSAFAAWAAFLNGYFDGNTHDVGANQAVPFPKANILFGQSPVLQPMNPAVRPLPAGGQTTPPTPISSINMVWSYPLTTCRYWERVNGVTQQRAYKKSRFNFWVRCEMQQDTAANARKVCRQTAERLSGLLGNAAATFALAECGIHHCRPGEPEMVAETAYILMLVTCRATLRYAVNSQVQS